MARHARSSPGGIVYHALNRAVEGKELFRHPDDYCAFLALLDFTKKRFAMRLLAWCLMPNHWHLVAWPREDGDLSRFVHFVTMRHAIAVRRLGESTGRGYVYQGRFRSFPATTDSSFLRICRYVERNAARAGLCARAEDWPWSSAAKTSGNGAPRLTADEWPVAKPTYWLDFVNECDSPEDLRRFRNSDSAPITGTGPGTGPGTGVGTGQLFRS